MTGKILDVHWIEVRKNTKIVSWELSIVSQSVETRELIARCVIASWLVVHLIDSITGRWKSFVYSLSHQSSFFSHQSSDPQKHTLQMALELPPNYWVTVTTTTSWFWDQPGNSLQSWGPAKKNLPFQEMPACQILAPLPGSRFFLGISEKLCEGHVRESWGDSSGIS